MKSFFEMTVSSGFNICNVGHFLSLLLSNDHLSFTATLTVSC